MEKVNLLQVLAIVVPYFLIVVVFVLCNSEVQALIKKDKGNGK